MLRAVLGAATGVEAAALRFAYGPRGKPRLADEAATNVRFNLSHAGPLALLALSRGREVGVDLEQLRELPDPTALARRVLAPAEQAALNALADPRARLERLLAAWVRKEAWAKAVGDGLARDLAGVEVSLEPGDARLLAVAGAPGEAARWTLAELPLEPGLLAALAVEGHGWRLERWQWAP